MGAEVGEGGGGVVGCLIPKTVTVEDSIIYGRLSMVYSIVPNRIV